MYNILIWDFLHFFYWFDFVLVIECRTANRVFLQYTAVLLLLLDIY